MVEVAVVIMGGEKTEEEEEEGGRGGGRESGGGWEWGGVGGAAGGVAAGEGEMKLGEEGILMGWWVNLYLKIWVVMALRSDCKVWSWCWRAEMAPMQP